MISVRTEAVRRFSGEGLAAQVLRLATANLLLVVCAKIAIPLPFTVVPITLQTFGVLLIAVLFGARASALAATLYLLEGALGLPVFQPFGAPGAARLFGPTAGYLLAYPVAAFVTGWLAERIPGASVAHWLAQDGWNAPREGAGAFSGSNVSGGVLGLLVLFTALVPGEALILMGGWAWLAMPLGPSAALAQGVLPFLPGDLLKMAAVAGIARVLRREQ
jgi:biotin transport system substrate-specific component